MKTKKIPSIISRSLWLLLMVSFMLLASGLRAEEPALPETAAGNMVLQLDATTLGLEEGDAVTEWVDQSLFGHDAGIALDNAPTYKAITFLGKPSVNFSGSGQYLEIPHSSDLDLSQLTMFVVFQNSSNVPEDFGVITSKELGSSPWTNRNWWLAVERQRGELWFRTSTGGQQPRNDLKHTTYNYKDNEPHLVSITVPGSNNGSSTLIVDGLQKANTLSTTPNIQTAPVRIGGAGSTTVNRFFQGDIGEIIIYNRALTSEERQAVEIYLGKKWIGLYADEYFVISATAGTGGIIVPEGDIELPAGASTSFNITPNAPFYEIYDVKVDGQSVGAVSSYTFMNVQDNHTIDAYFSPVDPDLVITATAGPNGSIEPSGTILKYPGQYQTFTFTPEGNYGVANVFINGEPQGPMSSYTFSNLLESKTIHVEFGLTGPIVHLDADAITGLEHGQAITTWVDKSGYGNNATQSNNNFKPQLITEDGLNGRKVVRFDGTNDALSVANNYSLDMDQITMFAVYRSTYRETYPNNSIGVLTAKSRGSTNRSWWLSLNNNFSAGGSEAGIDPGALWFRSSSGGGIANNLYDNGTYNDGNAYMVSIVVPPTGFGEQSKLYIDGEQKDQSNASVVDHAENQIMRIGAGTTNSGGVERWFYGDIAEIIIYNRALSDTERQEVEQMLQAKWFGPQIPEITEWPTASDITYGQALSASNLSAGEANVPGEFSFKYPEVIPVAAGPYTATVVFTPDDTEQWEIVEGEVELVVLKAALTVTAEDDSKVYDGLAYSGGNGVTYDGFVNEETEAVLGGTLTYSGTSQGAFNVDTYVITPEGLISDNYEITFADGQLEITKANATIDVQVVTVTYDGEEHGATGTAIGVNDEELAGLVLGAKFINVPGGTANWTFTDETGNYNDDAGSVEIVIEKADATIAVSGTTVTYDGAEHGATGTATGVDGEVLAGLDLGDSFTNVPGGTAYWTFTDVTGNYNDAAGSVEIVITEKLLIITAEDKERQYSDPNPEWTATFIGFVDSEDENVLDGTLTFTGPGPDSDNTTGPAGYAITPGGLTSSNYAITFVNGTLTIKQEDAQITYIGTRLMAVRAGGTATLDLRVVVDDDPDGYPGNIINADVTFLISWEGGSQTVSTDITTADLVNNQKAVVSVPFNVTLANGETSRTLNIKIEAGGYYFGEEEVIAIVYMPAGDHITGGGFIIPDEGSDGLYPSAPGTHANFGFNFKYHPRTGELQGQANLIIRGESGPPVQFKSNEALAMGINNSGTHPTAQFTVRGDLKQGNSLLASDVLMYATLTDRGNPGSLDDIGFTIWSGNSLLYSSDWKGNYTERMNLSGGNIVIHRGGTDAGEDFDILTEPFSGGLSARFSFSESIELKVYPNPFRSKLFIGFTAETTDRAIIELYDMNGSLIQSLFNGEVLEGQSYQFEYTPTDRVAGILFYRIVMGEKVVNGKLIRQQ